MFIVGMLSWWYSEGWRQRAGMVRERLASLADYFSIGLLAGTLFAPFRQISAGQVEGPLPVQLRAFVDRLISRMIGAVVRTGLIIIGLITLALAGLTGLLTIVAWGVFPLLPIVGVVLMIVGWVPAWP